MAESDPRDYRGGVHESGEDKGNEGVVPREMVDEPTADTSADDQELGDAVRARSPTRTRTTAPSTSPAATTPTRPRA